MTLRRSSQSHTDLSETSHESVPSSPITISKPSLLRSPSSRLKAKIRPWSLAVAGRWRGSFATNTQDQIKEDEDEEKEEQRRRDGYEWEVETGSESEPDGDGDADGDEAEGSQAGYSWVDPSVAGSHALRRTVSENSFTMTDGSLGRPLIPKPQRPAPSDTLKPSRQHEQKSRRN
jgi:hypothetical protein